MTTTERPVTPATVAEWRRRKEADGGLPLDGHNGQPVNGQGDLSVNGQGGPSVNGQGGPSVNGQGGPSVNGQGGPSVNGQGGPSVNGQGGPSVNGQGGPSVNGQGGPSVNGQGGPSVNGQGGPSVNGHNGQSVNGERSRNGRGSLPHAGENAKIRNGFRVPAYAAEDSLVPPSPGGETPFGGFHRMADAVISPPLDPTAAISIESQRAALDVMLNLSRAEAPLLSLPASNVVSPSADRPSASDRPSIIDMPGLTLTVILTVQAVLSLRLVWSNTAFSDEALYLWAGRLEWSHWLHNTPVPSFATYFSGSPVVYPPIGALANSVGGLAGARILSLSFMLGATVLLHGVTRRLFDRRSAAFAAALFAGLGSAQYLGAFATYDAMALFLLALATWLGIRAATVHSVTGRAAFALVAAVILVTADASKYAAALFDPVVVITVASFHWRVLGRRAGLVSGLLVACGSAAAMAIAIAWGGKSYWGGITLTTLARAQGNWPIFGILLVSAGWVGVIAGLATIGAVTVFYVRRTGPDRLLACTLAVAAFLAPAEQARIQVFTSLFKHVAFGAWFAAIVAGYALMAFVRAVPKVKARGAFRAIIAAVTLATISGALLSASHFAAWADTNAVLPTLDAALRADPQQPLLVDDTPPFDYYLEDVEPWQLISSVSPSSATVAIEAIKEHKFAYILLSFAAGGGSCGNYDPLVKSSRTKCQQNADLRAVNDIISAGGYELIARIPYKTTAFSSDFLLWKREGKR